MKGPIPPAPMLWVRAAIFLLLLPIPVIVVIPNVLATTATDVLELGPLRWLGVPLGLLGLCGWAWCLRDFVVQGRGTPAPYDPPKELVVRGLYRRSRNPMYVSVLTLLVAEALLWERSLLFLYAAGVFVGLHLWVTLYEEPTLRRRFGGAFERYTREVPRWLFR